MRNELFAGYAYDVQNSLTPLPCVDIIMCDVKKVTGILLNRCKCILTLFGTVTAEFFFSVVLPWILSLKTVKMKKKQRTAIMLWFYFSSLECDLWVRSKRIRAENHGNRRQSRYNLHFSPSGERTARSCTLIKDLLGAHFNRNKIVQ